MELFTAKDFKVFDIEGFQERMQAIAERIRPKLTGIGEGLAPSVAGLIDHPVYVHVARHARRTVNPPDDTWAALGTGQRGYKKDVHFKVAVSRNCLRLLFEVGPEYYDKSEYGLKWKREIGDIARTFKGESKLAWFRDEHDEDPAGLIRDLSRDDLLGLATELTRKRDGQLVIGRRIEAGDVAGMKPATLRRMAMSTFKPMAHLFTLHEPRAVGAA